MLLTGDRHLMKGAGHLLLSRLTEPTGMGAVRGDALRSEWQWVVLSVQGSVWRYTWAWAWRYSWAAGCALAEEVVEAVACSSTWVSASENPLE